MWAEYKLSADQAGIKAAAYTTFCSLWRQLVPHITVMKPMTDLCWVCQQFSVAIMRSANTPESAKSYYRSAIEISKEVLRQMFTVNGCLLVLPVGSRLPPLSWDVEMHFSLDMAQQVWRMQLSPVQTLICMCKFTGALSQRSTAAWAMVLSHTPQVHHLRGVL